MLYYTCYICLDLVSNNNVMLFDGGHRTHVDLCTHISSVSFRRLQQHSCGHQIQISK